jgi:hypothetical protein
VYPVEVAISVRAQSLPGFPAAEGVRYWVGPPRDVPDENTAVPEQTVRVAPLQCEPYIADWSTFGLVHAYGAEIIPGARYEVTPIEDPDWCRRTDGNLCSHPSGIVTTAKFGDVWPVWDWQLLSAQPDFNDLAAFVRKFQATPSQCSGGANDRLACAGAGDCPSGSCEDTAPSKVYVQLVPNVVRPDRPVDFREIAAAVEAFAGTPFANVNHITGPCACPSSVVCGVTACAADTQCSGGYCIEGFCTDSCGRCTP